MLRVEGISKQYEQMAVDNVSFVVDDGEIFVILGPSGAGKTTLLRLIAGFEKPTSGSIFVDDLDLDGVPSDQRQMAMIFQDGALFPHVRVKDNIQYGMKRLGYTKQEIEEKTKIVSSQLHIEGLLDRYPTTLSAGEKQRVGIARALIRHPKILLMDEPFSSLDVRLQEELHALMKQIHEETKMTMIMITHDQKEAFALADRIALMNEGKLMALDVPDKLYREPHNLFTAMFIGEQMMNLWPIDDAPIHIDGSEGKTIGVRGEDVQLGDGERIGTIIQIEKVIGAFIYTLQVDQYTLRAVSKSSYGIGEEIAFSIHESNIHVFQEGF